MSFCDLASARRAKEQKSFVQSTAGPSRDPNQAGVAPAPDAQPVSSSAESLEPAPEPVDLAGLHAALPASLEIRARREAGRGIFSLRAHKAGSVLMRVRPHVSVLSTPFLDAYCSHCCGAAPAAGLRRCTRCRVVWYCGPKCQNADWPLHKAECAALQSWAAEAPSPAVAIPSDAIRCLGRVLWTMQRKGLDSVWAREINMMQSHRHSLPRSAYESHTQLAHFLVRYLNLSSPAALEPFGLHSAGDLVDLISRFTTNTFTLTSASLTGIGVCMSPTVAFANHSCEPNVAVVFPRTSSSPEAQEPLMHMVAIRDIAPEQEIFMSYVDATLPRHIRQRDLEDTYNFVCKCSLCARSMEVDPRWAVWCPKSCGGMLAAPTEEDTIDRCAKCGEPLRSRDDVLDAFRLGQEALDKGNLLRSEDLAKATRLTTNMIPLLTSARLAPSSHPLLAITRLHQELLTASLGKSLTQDVLDDAIRAAARYNAGLSPLLPAGHPVRGVALAELGKLLAVDEVSPPTDTTGHAFPPSGAARLRLADKTLISARDELLVGFGTESGGGPIGREVRAIIVRLEKELGAWNQGIRNVLEDTRASSAGARGS